MVVMVVGRWEIDDLAAGGGRGFLAVEVAVAVAGGAFEGVEGAFSSGRHELAAAVDSVTAESDGVVLQALSVPAGLSGWWGVQHYWAGCHFGAAGVVVE